MTAALLLPFFSALAVLFFGKRARLRSLCATALFAIECVLLIILFLKGKTVISAGGWPTPYGIILTADPVSTLIAPFVAFVFLIASWVLPDDEGIRRDDITYSLLFFLQGGVMLALFTADFFNLFVAFELMLTATYGLLSLHADKETRGGVLAYLVLNLVGGMIFLTAAGVAYGAFGQLNFAALRQELTGPYLSILASLALIIVGLKAAIYPIFQWLSAAYRTLPPTLQGLFGGVLTKIGVYVAYRFFIGVALIQVDWMPPLLLFISGLTMLIGVCAAISQKAIDDILSNHIVSQVGYMFFGIALGSEAAISAGLFFLLHNVVTKSSLFFVAEAVKQHYGSVKLDDLGKIAAVCPLLGALFLVQALSLAGFPPFSGFWGKYILFLEGIKSEAYLTTAVAVLTSWLTLFSMVKIWCACFWGKHTTQEISRPFLAPLTFCAAVMIFMGLFAQPLLDHTTEAAATLIAGGTE